MENVGMKRKSIKSILTNKINAWIRSIDDEELQNLCKRDTVVTGGCIPSMLSGEEVNDYDIYFRTYETTLKVAQYYVDKFIKNLQDKGKKPPPIRVDETTDIRGEPRIRIIVRSAGVESEVQTEQPYQYFESRPAHEAENYVSEVFTDPEEVADKHEELQEASFTDSKKKNDPYRPVFVSTNAISLSNDIQIVLRFFGEPEDIHKNYDFVHCTNYWLSENGELYLNTPALESLLSKTLVYQGSRYPLCSLFQRHSR